MTAVKHPILGQEQEKQLKHMENAIVKIESQLSEVRRTQAEQSLTLTSILVVLRGDELGNEGYSKRMLELEKEAAISVLERAKNNVYITIIKWLLAVIGLGVIGFVMNVVLTKPN